MRFSSESLLAFSFHPIQGNDEKGKEGTDKNVSDGMEVQMIVRKELLSEGVDESGTRLPMKAVSPLRRLVPLPVLNN